MRVLVCSSKDLAHPSAGDAEVYIHEVNRHWAAQGHEVTLFTAAVDDRDPVERSAGVTIIRRGARSGVYREAREFCVDEAAGRFDLVIDHVNARPFGCASWGGDAPVVAIVHWIEPRWLRRFADVPVITLSPSSRQSLRQHGLRRVRVVPPGCDIEPRPVVTKESRPTVAFVGQLAAHKRPDDAVKAFELFRESQPDAQLWVIGTGPLERSLARRVGDHVTFYGQVGQAEKVDLLTRAHVVVVTSVREAWGLVVDEAAACGTRAVAYDLPGLRDSVPAADGLLVPPDPSALADELLRRLPSWAALPPTRGWRGGATSWGQVAAAVLEGARADVAAGLS
ncbi:MAG TPA: glycosyltransferase family 4 protein [Acidimicrobiia bacterium]|nr:glycosyltransferase family 4 protein [Acidimicrobiia bacterium]